MNSNLQKNTKSEIINEFNRHSISIPKKKEEKSIKSKYKYSIDIKNPNGN